MARLASALSLGRARCFFGRAGESVASYLSDWVASASLAVVEAVSTVSVSCGCFWSRRRFRLFLFLWCWFRSPQWFRLFFISSWSRPVSVVSFVWVGVGLSVWFLGRKKCGGVVVAKKSGGAEMWTLRMACAKFGGIDNSRYLPVYAGRARSGIL